MRIICNKGKLKHTKQLFQPNRIINVSKLNILKKRLIFTELDSHNRNYVQSTHDTKTSKHSISIRDPYIWNSILNPEEKQITTVHRFKAMTELRWLLLKNELIFS